MAKFIVDLPIYSGKLLKFIDDFLWFTYETGDFPVREKQLRSMDQRVNPFHISYFIKMNAAQRFWWVDIWDHRLNEFMIEQLRCRKPMELVQLVQWWDVDLIPRYPLVNILKNYWKWQFIVNFPIEHGDFP